MIKSNRGRKILSIEYIFLFVIILYAGGASSITNSLRAWTSLIGIVVPIIIAGIVVLKNKIVFGKNYYKIIGVFTLYFIINTIQYKEFHPKFYGIWFVNLSFAFIIIKSMGLQLFKMIDDIMVKLSLIGLIGWLLLIIFKGPFTLFMETFQFAEPSWEITKNNIIIYAIQSLEERNQFAIVRNSGFAWEPGLYAVLVALGIYSNLIVNRFHFNNMNFWILLIALLSTQSTTGFGLLILIILFYQINVGSKLSLFAWPFILAIGLYIFTLPFMYEKINLLTEFDVEERVENSLEYDEPVVTQRIESFAIDWIDFTRSPLFGYGGDRDSRWTVELGAEINTISGIGKVLGQYGLFGVVIFFWLLSKASIHYSNAFFYRGKWVFFIFVLFASLSYSIIFTPLFLSLWMFSVFQKNIKVAPSNSSI